jgi:hypothetical protein
MLSTRSEYVRPCSGRPYLTGTPCSPGSVAVSTLSQWIDVLHLSSKWDFPHARAAAIQAIPPLASPMDKIVLGRTYELSEWLPDAFAGVVKRDQAITIQEARRVTLEDLVAIVNGRVAARSGAVKSLAEIGEITRSVLGLIPQSPLPILDAADLDKTLESPPFDIEEPSATTSPQIEKQFQEEQIIRWLAQTSVPSSATAAYACLRTYTKRHAWSRLYMLTHILKGAFNVFVSDVIPHCFDAPSLRGHCKSSPRVDKLLQSMKMIGNFRDSDGYEALEYELIEACQPVIDYWSIFKTLPYNLVTWHHLFDSQVYFAFWKTLRLLFEQPCSSKHMACRASVVSEALNQLNFCVNKLAVAIEQDRFYHTIERIALSARRENRSGDAEALEVGDSTFL